jgi:hypothetical protein
VIFVHPIGGTLPNHITAPSIQPDGSLAIRSSEAIVYNGNWAQLRIYRDGIRDENLDAAFTDGGILVVTDERLVWLTNPGQHKRSNAAGDAAILATGSLVAGLLTDAAVNRKRSKAVRNQLMGGQVHGDWIRWIGYYEPSRVVRLQLVDEFSDANQLVSFDITLPDGSGKVIVERFVERLAQHRTHDERNRPAMRQARLAFAPPTVLPDGTWFGTSLPGWRTTSGGNQLRAMPY